MKRFGVMFGVVALVAAAGCGDDSGGGSGGGATSGGASGAYTGPASRTSGGARPSFVETQFQIAEAAAKGEHADGGKGVMPLTKSEILNNFNGRLAQIESQLEKLTTLAASAGETWSQKVAQLATQIAEYKAKRDEFGTMDPMNLAALKPVALELEAAYTKMAGTYRELRGQFGSQLTDMNQGGGGQQNRTEGGPPPGVGGPRGPGGQ